MERETGFEPATNSLEGCRPVAAKRMEQLALVETCSEPET